MRIENLFVHSNMPDAGHLRFLSIALGGILLLYHFWRHRMTHILKPRIQGLFENRSRFRSTSRSAGDSQIFLYRARWDTFSYNFDVIPNDSFQSLYQNIFYRSRARQQILRFLSTALGLRPLAQNRARWDICDEIFSRFS